MASDLSHITQTQQERSSDKRDGKERYEINGKKRGNTGKREIDGQVRRERETALYTSGQNCGST